MNHQDQTRTPPSSSPKPFLSVLFSDMPGGGFARNTVLFLCLLLSAIFASAQESKIDLSASRAPESSDANRFDDLEIAPDGRLAKMERVTGKVIDVHDGDTIRMIDANKTQYKCRFNGIDAPELKQDFGSKSRQSLADMIFGKIVTIEYDKIDKYGRNVCRILLGWMDVNLEQIRRGMAWHYKKYQDEQTPNDRKAYAEAEITARNQKLGLWGQGTPTPPWDWRRGENNPNLDGVPKGAIIGNTNSMIYHTPGCSTYAKVSPNNRIVFAGEKEAIQKGYKLSGACETTLPVEERQPKTKEARVYQTGPRGGCFYINSAGKKIYVDKQFCQSK